MSGCYVLLCAIHLAKKEQIASLEVIKLEFFLKLKIKRNDWLLVDTCLQANQSLRLILSLRLYSSFITLRPDLQVFFKIACHFCHWCGVF